MPNINESTTDKITNKGPDLMNESTMTASITNLPVVTCGVNRRVNLGNYEHLDIFAGLALPIDLVLTDEILEKISTRIAETMNVVSRETNERFKMITEAQGGGRPPS